MNLFDITQADIERLKAMDGTDDFTTRDKEIRDVIGRENFQYISVCRLRPDYTLPATTEAEIIKYLQASEVSPSQWHPAAQEWAKRHNNEDIWEMEKIGGWVETDSVYTIVRDFVEWNDFMPHRLRADYGKAKEPIIAQPCYNPSDVSYGPFTLEPEVCVWEGSHVRTVFKDPHGRSFYFHITDIKDGCFCPVCGKRIEKKP